MSTTDPMPSAEIVFDTLFAYQKSAALKTAIDLELFTAIESAAYLSKRSPAYLGTIANFLLRPELKDNFENLTEAVRRGGVGPHDTNIVSNENPVWVEFAR